MIKITKFNNPDNRKTNKRTGSVQWIVIHYTAGFSSESGNAMNQASGTYNGSRQASADYYVDDANIVQFNNNIKSRYCWSVGGEKYLTLNTSLAAQYYNKCTNLNSISVEMCSSKTNRYSQSVTDNDWYITDAVISNTRELVKYLMNEYNIDVNHVIMHHQVTGKWCPQPWTKNEQSLKFWYSFKESLVKKEEKPLVASGVYIQSNNNSGIVAGLVTNKNEQSGKDIEYRWVACEDDGTPDWFEISPWTKNNEWLNWKPEKYGNYVIVGYARIAGENTTTEGAAGVKYHPYIKGTCQMPKDNETTLIGIESYNNDNYSYEISILDCTLLAQGKDAWIYSSGKCKSNSNFIWVTTDIDYGYYWTLFRIYDSNNNLIDEECYGFVNV